MTDLNQLEKDVEKLFDEVEQDYDNNVITVDGAMIRLLKLLRPYINSTVYWTVKNTILAKLK